MSSHATAPTACTDRPRWPCGRDINARLRSLRPRRRSQGPTAYSYDGFSADPCGSPRRMPACRRAPQPGPTDRRALSALSLVPSLAADHAWPTAACPRTRRIAMESDEASTFAGRSLQVEDARAPDRRYDCLDDAARLARRYLDGLRDRPVHAKTGLDELRA